MVQVRDGKVDFVRGITIFLVLWGHLIQQLSAGGYDFFENKVFMVIYSFHMPLFAFLSGYTFFLSSNEKTFKEIVNKKLIGIGIPLLSWAAIDTIINLINDVYIDVNSILKGFGCNITGIWFLVSIFLSSILVAIASGIVKQYHPLQALLMYTFVFLLVFTPNQNNNIFIYPYFVFGFIANQQSVLNNKGLMRALTITIPIWIAMLFFYRKDHYIYISGIMAFDNRYSIYEHIMLDLFRYAVGLAGTIAIIIIAYYIYDKTKNSNLVQIIQELGKRSLGIYVLQRLFLERLLSVEMNCIMDYLDDNPLLSNMFIFNFVITPLLAVCYAIILYNIEILIEKIPKLRFVLLGKR